MTDDFYKENDDIEIDRIDDLNLPELVISDGLKDDFLLQLVKFYKPFADKNPDNINSEFFDELLTFLEQNQNFFSTNQNYTINFIRNILDFLMEYAFPSMINDLDVIFSKALLLLFQFVKIIDNDQIKFIISWIETFFDFFSSNELYSIIATKLFIEIYKKSETHADFYIFYIYRTMNIIQETFDINSLLDLIELTGLVSNSYILEQQFYHDLFEMCLNIVAEALPDDLYCCFFGNLSSLFSCSDLFRLEFQNEFSFFTTCLELLNNKSTNDTIFSILQFLYTSLKSYKKDNKTNMILKIFELLTSDIYFDKVFPYIINVDHMSLFVNLIDFHYEYQDSVLILPNYSIILLQLTNLIHNAIAPIKILACKLLFIFSDVCNLGNYDFITNDTFIQDIIKILDIDSDDNNIFSPIKIIAEIAHCFNLSDNKEFEKAEGLYDCLIDNDIYDIIDNYKCNERISSGNKQAVEAVLLFLEHLSELVDP